MKLPKLVLALVCAIGTVVGICGFFYGVFTVWAMCILASRTDRAMGSQTPKAPIEPRAEEGAL